MLIWLVSKICRGCREDANSQQVKTKIAVVWRFSKNPLQKWLVIRPIKTKPHHVVIGARTISTNRAVKCRNRQAWCGPLGGWIYQQRRRSIPFDRNKSRGLSPSSLPPNPPYHHPHLRPSSISQNGASSGSLLPLLQEQGKRKTRGVCQMKSVEIRHRLEKSANASKAEESLGPDNISNQ